MKIAKFVNNLDSVSYNIKYISSVILFPIGLIGNLVVFAIYIRKKFRAVAMSRYLAMLAICNIVSTLTLLFTIFNIEWAKTDTFCKYYTFIRYCDVQFAAWLLVLNSIDRLLTIYYATKSTNILVVKLFITNFKFQVFVILLIFTLIIAINIPFILYSTYFKTNGSCGLPERVGLIVDILDMLTSTVIPFIIMLATSIMIIKMLSKSRNRLNANQNVRTSESTASIFNKIKSLNINNGGNNRRDYQFAKTVIILNLLFLICNLPICILLIIWNYYSFTDPYVESQIKLGYSIFSIFIYCYSAMPIFIYLKVNTIFRRDVLLTVVNFKERCKKLFSK